MIEEDGLFEELARLARVEPNSEREARVRRRCYAELGRRGAAVGDKSMAKPRGFGLLADIGAVVALGAYVAAMYAEAMRLLGRPF